MTEKHKRGHPVVFKDLKYIKLGLCANDYYSIPGNRTAYIRDATKRQMVEDGLIKGGKE